MPARSTFPWPTHLQGMGLTIVEDLIAAAENKRPPLCSGEDGRAALEVAIALRESHRKGGVRVDLPMADRTLKILSQETPEDHTPARIRRLQAAERE